jgi:hypothetical protein
MLKTVFKDCLFLSVDNIPIKNKEVYIDGNGKTFYKCTFFIEKGKPAIMFILPKVKWYKRILNKLFRSKDKKNLIN